MSKTACAIASALALASSLSWAAAFEWVNGSVTHITAQLGNYTVAMVSGRGVRFCDPETGSDYAITADNLHFDLLKTALLHSKSVQVGVQNFGKDSSGSEKLCIDRVILTN
jgi:hypothetical protein